MRKVALTLLIAMICNIGAKDVYAGGRKWSNAGKILTGAIGISLIADALHPQIVDPILITPRNRHNNRYNHGRNRHKTYNRRNRRKKTWIPGHYEIVERKIWIPRERRKIWVEPEYDMKYIHGRRKHIKIRDGFYTYETIPGHYEIIQEKIWIHAKWEKVRHCY